MKRLVMTAIFALCACEREAPEQVSAPVTPQALPVEAPASKPSPVIPRPADPAQLDRLILAGYTPHADHLHAPGVNECPLTKGTDAVM